MDKLDILKKLTIEEKVNWTSGHNMWKFLGHEKLGVKEIFLADGPHGLRAYTNLEKELNLDERNLAETTLFPNAAAMASTFNEELLFQVGKTIATECNMHHVDVLLGPGVNLKRSPLGGRNFEYYSEDPYLTGRMATNFIKGVQSQKVGACIKHFALNEQETNRRFVNTIVDERTLHELYLKPFKMAIDEAKPYAIMSAYNKINGHYASESKELLIDILRKKWDFKGIVISDWGAIQNKPKSLQTGINIEMPGNSEFNAETFEALKNGTLLEEDIDQSLLPLLELEELVNQNDLRGTKTDLYKNHNFARKVASESIVLLENDGILPIQKGIKLGVIGDFAMNPRINGGGSATLKPFIKEVPLEFLKENFDVSYAQGYIDKDTNDQLLQEVESVCKDNEIILYYTGTTPSLEEEGKDREHMNLPQGHIDVFEKIKKHAKKVIVILNNGSAINVRPLKDANALIEGWLLGSANGQVMVDVLTGTVNPSGRLSETFPISIETTPQYKLFPSRQDEVYYHGDIINTGYRYYDMHNVEVKYPFGYGLSYSSFTYSNLKLSKNQLKNIDTLDVSLQVTNTSDRDGQEVIQLYVRDRESYYPRPNKELNAFKKVFIKAQETVTVTFTLDESAFSIYAVDYHDFKVETGYYDILIGKNVKDIVLQDTIYFDSNTPIRTTLSLAHPLKNFFLYKPESVNYIKEKYGREFPWYEIEEPAIRVLKRVKSQYNISDEEFNKMLEKLIK